VMIDPRLYPRPPRHPDQLLSSRLALSRTPDHRLSPPSPLNKLFTADIPPVSCYLPYFLRLFLIFLTEINKKFHLGLIALPSFFLLYFLIYYYSKLKNDSTITILPIRQYIYLNFDVRYISLCI